MTRGIWRATFLNVSFETNFHSVSEGGGGPDSATFSPAFSRDIYFLYRNDPSTAGTLSHLASCILKIVVIVQNICHVNIGEYLIFMTIESTLVQSMILKQYLSISFCFLQEVRTLMPLQSSHQCKAGAVCLSKGLERSAPGISAGESVTSISSVGISNKSRFSRTLRSICLIQDSMCLPMFLVLR